MSFKKLSSDSKNSSFDHDTVNEYVNMLVESGETGSCSVMLEDGIHLKHIPQNLYDMCVKYDISPEKAIYSIVSDFFLRLEKGNSKYEKGIMNKIKKCDSITEYDKKRIFKTILNYWK